MYEGFISYWLASSPLVGLALLTFHLSAFASEKYADLVITCGPRTWNVHKLPGKCTSSCSAVKANSSPKPSTVTSQSVQLRISSSRAETDD